MTKQTSILFLTMALSVALPCVAQTSNPSKCTRAEAAFEELPELKASEILKTEIYRGAALCRVRDPVPTASGMNQFTIDSDFGLFEADGNEMLLQRLKEIDAIARLRDVSRTDAFKEFAGCRSEKPAQLGQEYRERPGAGDFQCPKGNYEIPGARQGDGPERRKGQR